jgi:rod shape-determining protein MreD
MIQERRTEQPFAWWQLGLDVGEGLLVVSFQTTLLYLVPWGIFRPDCVFLFLAYKAITRPQIPCLLLAFMTGFFQDSLSSISYFGTATFCGLLMVLLIGLVRNSIPREKRFLPFLIIVLVGSLVYHLVYGTIVWVKGGQAFPSLLLGAGLGSVTTTLVSFVVLGIFHFTRSSIHGRYGT